MNGSIKSPPEGTTLKQNNSTTTLKSTVKRVTWTNLCYQVPRSGIQCLFRRRKTAARRRVSSLPDTGIESSVKGRLVLNKLNGNIGEGCLNAILGPSGSGKSTLIECLFGKRRSGLTGEINYTGFQSSELEDQGGKKTGRVNSDHAIENGTVFRSRASVTNRATRASSSSICFISQEDHLFDRLTVREAVMFASCVKNTQTKSVHEPKPDDGKRSKQAKSSHDIQDNVSKVNAVLSQLWLESCADVMTCDCSGGQKKRISIACELVSDPVLLFLDEPTSGLDSSTAFQCIRLLKGLTTTGRNLSILLSIHQPSSTVLELFDQLYILSRDGTNIYFGPPSELISYLSSFNLHCPKFHNPADFVIEIASSPESASLMDSRRPSLVPFMLGSKSTKRLISNKPKIRIPNSPGILTTHLSLILTRTAKIIIREPLLTSMRLLAHVFVAVAVSLLYGTAPGRATGCNSYTSYGSESFLDQKIIIYTNENMTLLFFILFFLTFTSLTPTILTFPSELKVFMKENCNGWYNCAVYFTAVTIVDLPMTIIFPLSFVSIIYPMTGQIMDAERFILFIIVSCLASFVSQSVGILISTVFAKSVKVIVFLAPVSLTPAFLFSGFFVRPALTPYYLKPLYYMSYIKYSLDCFICIVYGLDRCRNSNMRTAGLSVSDNDYPDYDVNKRRIFVPNITSSLADTSFLSSNESMESSEIISLDSQDSIMNMTQRDDDRMFTSAQFGYSGNTFSYVMKEFDLKEEDSWTQIRDSCLILLAMVFVLRIISFIFLLHVTRATR